MIGDPKVGTHVWLSLLCSLMNRTINPHLHPARMAA